MIPNHKSRLTMLFFIFVAVYTVLMINLYSIQVRQNTYFSHLGSQQYKVTVTSIPPRAEIYDRNGQALALNKESLAAFLIPQRLEQPEAVIQFLKKHFPQAATRLAHSKKSHFMYIKRRLTDAQQELIQKSQLPDIKLLKEPSRFYPIPSVGPLVGITDIDNQGTLGIEQLYNAQLTGKASTHVLEKDARSGHFYFKRETKVQGIEGKPITLTLDSTLQFLVHEELKNAVAQLGSQEGAALVINPATGEILALANYPDFDPNNTEHIDIGKTKNRVSTDAYELGSVIKAFLALAALQEDVVTADELIDCENTKATTLDGIKFSTWKANGLISFSEVIQYSNNIGVAKVALRLGPKLYEHYKRLGFGQKIGILPGENNGFITPPERWSRASVISLSFGYEISATLLQLAQAFSIIAQDGHRIPVHLVKTEQSSADPTPLYTPEVVAVLKNILLKTITQGTKQALTEGYTIRGKTGTARLLTNGKYDPHRHIFTFMGLIEKGSYKRIIITFIKETTKKDAFASSTAVPLFEKIAHKIILHDKTI
ncbi:penicillin-binding protein 2 [Candidatus Dependentiae bacterium]|nr:penicillin-binding protein 2 [Candidatus Dependentiae bacterium]